MTKIGTALRTTASSSEDQEPADMVEEVIAIGKSGLCTKDNLIAFLPSFPKIHGSEPFLTIDRVASKMQLSTEEVVYLIKGCHLIDKKYGELTDNLEFGIGSPCKTTILIKTLEKYDQTTASECYSWVAANHGNYYIEPH